MAKAHAKFKFIWAQTQVMSLDSGADDRIVVPDSEKTASVIEPLRFYSVYFCGSRSFLQRGIYIVSWDALRLGLAGGRLFGSGVTLKRHPDQDTAIASLVQRCKLTETNIRNYFEEDLLEQARTAAG